MSLKLKGGKWENQTIINGFMKILSFNIALESYGKPVGFLGTLNSIADIS